MTCDNGHAMKHSIPVRNLPRHVIVTRLKLHGVRQEDIAKRAGVTQSHVSRVIARRFRGTELVERVWREIERVLIGETAA